MFTNVLSTGFHAIVMMLIKVLCVKRMSVLFLRNWMLEYEIYYLTKRVSFVLDEVSFY